MGEIIIRGGVLCDPSQKIDTPKDIWVQDGKIHAIENPGQIPAKPGVKEIQLRGEWILPGLIDIHVHFREPGLEYKETIATGSRAAVAGGFTSVACMANTLPVNDNPYVTSFILHRAKESAQCRVFPIGAVTKGLKGEVLSEMGGMAAQGVVAFSDDGMPVMNSYLMRKAMDYARAFGLPIISHAEDLNLVGQGVMNEGALSNELGLRGIPAAAEEIMVAREIALCRLTRTPIHIAHISTQVALEHVLRAKEAGLPVTAEASPHHLVLTEEAVRTYDTNCKMAPALRTEKDVEALRDAVKTGLVDVIATDHAPHGSVDKNVEFSEAANGILGLQTAVPLTLELVHKGIISKEKWISALTIGPAKLLKLPYGTLKKGSVADITILSPDYNWTLKEADILSKSKNTPFIGWNFKGKIFATLIEGKIRYESLSRA